MNIGFWNTNNNKEIDKYIIDLIIEKNIDIFVMAEYEGIIEKLLNNLYIKGKEYKFIKGIGCKKITIIYKNNIYLVRNLDVTDYLSVNVKRETLEFELFGVHFPSKLHASDRKREYVANTLKVDIEKYDKAIVIGDFNCNPFENAISAFSGMNALPTKEKEKRMMHGFERSILYNPMWNFFGDFEKIPGTYYYDNSDDINYYWNIFDQVLISHELLELYENKSIEIVKNIKDNSLIRNNKVIMGISDHLPILFSLKEEENG